MKMPGNPVKLYVYELSRGLARQMSPLLLGKQIDGIWHTGIVVFGREYFFGGGGVEYCSPGGTILGEPDEIIHLGETQVTRALFEEYLRGLGGERFRPEMYHLFEHNCNTFSNELAQFLTGGRIPKHIHDLPNDVMNTAFGAMIKPLVDSMSVRPAGGASVTGSVGDTGHSAAAGPEGIFEPRVEQQGTAENANGPTRDQKVATGLEQPSPAVFEQTDLPSILLHIKDELQKDNMEELDLKRLEEIESILLQKGSAVKDEHIRTLGKILDKCMEEQLPLLLSMLQVLQVAMRKESFVSHPEGEDLLRRVVERYSNFTSKDIQLNILCTLCNACSSSKGHRILTRNRVFTQLSSLVVNELLGGETDIQEAAIALAYNIALAKVSEDIALECATALIEVLTQASLTSSKSGFRCLFALKNFMEWSEEVKSLALVMGVDLGKFRGKTKDMDKLCRDLERLLK